MAKKLKTFNVQLSIHLNVSTEVRAETLEQALADVRTWKALDIIDIGSLEYIDDNIEVQGVVG